jgi:hypothetical protein
LINSVDLKAYTVKQLGEMAKEIGLTGWSSLRKNELVKALLHKVRSKKASRDRKARSAKKNSGPRSGSKVKSSATTIKRRKVKSRRALQRVKGIRAKKKRAKDLANDEVFVGAGPRSRRPEKDRIVLLVRDAYWLHVYWEITRQSTLRARAAMAEHWHTAQPILRLVKVDHGTTTSTAERVVRDVLIHSGVRNWYIDVIDPPGSFRVDIGYLSDTGRLYTLARSNIVTTPEPGSIDSIDENWNDVAENYDKIYSLSGGNEVKGNRELKQVFEEQLRRPMNSPVIARYGTGKNRKEQFNFDVDAELIIFGSTRPDATITLGGNPVKLRPDGSFTVRMHLPDKRQVLPVVASSADGMESRTVVLAVERNTKTMEPIVRDPNV